MRADLLDALRCPRTGARLRCAVLAARGDEVEAALLVGGAVPYPVLEGVPVLREVPQETHWRLRAGDTVGALAAALRAEVGPGRLAESLAAAAGSGRTGRTLRRVAHTLGERRTRAVAAAAATDDGWDLVRAVYVESPARSLDAYDYFTHRLATPRHLVALACLEHLPDPTGPVLDLGCGTGLLTGALALRFPGHPVVGVDRALFLAVAARRLLGPAGQLVCADLTTPPFGDAWAGGALACDVLSFVRDKRLAFAELRRVLRPGGWVVCSSLINATCPRGYRGDPVDACTWRALAHDFPAVHLFDDDRILDAYLAGDGVSAGLAMAPGALDASPRVTLVAGVTPPAVPPAFATWPHARGALGINPLYVPARALDGGVLYARRFPSATFVEEQPRLSRYLPPHAFVPRAFVPRAGVLAASGGRDHADLDRLVRTFAIVGYPTVSAEPARPRPPPG